MVRPPSQVLSLERARGLLPRLDVTVDAERFAAERAQSLPLPERPFDTRRTHAAVGVSRRALVCVDATTYSVPCTWAGLEITAHGGADAVATVLENALAESEPLLPALAPAPPPSPIVDRNALPVALRGVEVDAGCAADYDAPLARGAP